ncbi:CDP-glycerol glycerophosphotransferase family protein [Bacillus sp. V59.32b]|uniref:CDP-glycerol glycerophosphotransferase family protein n=1 Tax=Bacillus sp. V59.32b TaxID=1758642 RepID=UPI000E3E0C7E|nr:CDP-glycerol glycerophosphotransferase family protein [Bacillus sp. V59.32b]RFU66844.1 CDP-glycerol--glycerophosphate glycerophosphotransferase [Bacillus sp. V59.32b]
MVERQAITLRLIPTLVTKFFIKFVYNLFCLLFKVNPQKITFASYRSDNLTGNLYYVWKEINTHYSEYECFFRLKKFDSSFKGKLEYFFHLIVASFDMATSKYFIIDDYYFPVYVITPREGTEVIQLWHAAGAFKKFGLSTIGKEFGPSDIYLKHVKVHSNYARVYVSSTDVIPYYSEAFGMPEERIFPLGLPRTDYFFDKHEIQKAEETFYQKYPQLIDKKLILYAPTFRGRSHYQTDFESPIDFAYMKDELGSDYALIVHLHPYMSFGLNVSQQLSDFVYHIQSDFNIEQLLVLSDILITDYSSVIFDYSLLERPIAFFSYDLEEYIRERDFYIDYQSEVPGPIFTDTVEMSKWIREGDFELNSVLRFKKRFFDYTGGKASTRIVDHLLG